MKTALAQKLSNHKKSSRTSRSRRRTNNQSITFVRKFKKEGKQGLAGLCKINIDGERKTMVYKTSRYLNFTSLHEYYVMKSLQSIIPFCPYFCEVHDILNVTISPNFREQTNPFAIEPNKYTIEGDVLIMDYIKGKNLYSLVKRKEIGDRIIFSAMRQTLAAIMIAQNEVNFTHYDLHSSNIILTPCEANSISLFISGENVIYSPTYGAKPVVIDFGFSYSDALRKKPIMSSLAHTDIGFMSYIYDKYSDVKLFLISLAYESKLHREKSPHFKLFRKLVKKIFKPLKVDYTSGWDKGYSEVSAIDRVNDLISNIEPTSQVFGRYNHFALDLIQNMIKLPLRGKKIKDLGISFIAIDSELAKLDNEIGSSFHNLYIFKKITEIAFKLRNLYENKAKRKKVVKLFKRKIYSELDKISKYCMPSLNFERLLCGLLVYSDAVEGVLYRSCKDVWEKKHLDYNKMKYNSVIDICKYLDQMLPDNYRMNNTTVVRVSDANNRKYREFTLSSSEAKQINRSSTKSEVLLDIYTTKFYRDNKIDGVRPITFSDIDSDDLNRTEESEEESGNEGEESDIPSVSSSLEERIKSKEVTAEDFMIKKKERSDDSEEKSENEERSDSEEEQGEKEKSENEERSDSEEEQGEKEKSENEERSDSEEEQGEKEKSENEERSDSEVEEKEEVEEEHSGSEKDVRMKNNLVVKRTWKKNNLVMRVLVVKRTWKKNNLVVRVLVVKRTWKNNLVVRVLVVKRTWKNNLVVRVLVVKRTWKNNLVVRVLVVRVLVVRVLVVRVLVAKKNLNEYNSDKFHFLYSYKKC